MRHMYPLKLKPVYDRRIWGNDKLAKIRNNPESHGSSWDISAHPHADNTVLNGEYKGMKLSEMLDTYPEEMLGEKKRSQMLRLSILDTAATLSVQVHPTDDYAHKYENDEGKTEAWYIIEAEPNSTLIAGTTAKSVDEIRQAVENDTVEDICKKHDMEEGDLICIYAGQLHAMGAGMIALEVSQNSDVTYRFYDFHRKDDQGNERELHVKKSLDVVDCTKQCEKEAFPLDKKFINKPEKVLDIDEFTMEILDLDGEYVLETDKKRFFCLTNVENDITLECEGEVMDFPFTESIFIPAQCENVTLKGKGRIIISYVR